jgi:hypothetical protein
MAAPPPPVNGNEPELALAAATVDDVSPDGSIDVVVEPSGSMDVVVEPSGSMDVVVVDDEVVDVASPIDVVVVLVEDVVDDDVVVAGFVQSKGTHAVTPCPMFQVSARKPCLPATNAVTSIGNFAGATPWYGNVIDASSVTGTTPAGGGVVPYTKCSVMYTRSTAGGSTMSILHSWPSSNTGSVGGGFRPWQYWPWHCVPSV